MQQVMEAQKKEEADEDCAATPHGEVKVPTVRVNLLQSVCVLPHQNRIFEVAKLGLTHLVPTC